MKTIKFLLIAGLILTAGMAKSLGGENETKSQAYKQLDEQIHQSLMSFPFEEISRQNESMVMKLTFTVNNNHEMVNIKVTGEDDLLARYVQNKLEQQKIKVDSYFDGKTCRVPLRFIDARL